MSPQHKGQFTRYLLTAVFGLIFIAYPLLVYQFGNSVSPKWFASALMLITLIRAYLLRKQLNKNDFMFTSFILLFITSLFFADNQLLLKFYPVIMSLGIGLLFLSSMYSDQCLIEKFASLGKNPPPLEAKPYLRKLTVIWGSLIITNAMVSAYTACYSSTAVWALYNGLLSYVIFGVFAAGEYIFRGYYKKKHNINDG